MTKTKYIQPRSETVALSTEQSLLTNSRISTTSKENVDDSDKTSRRSWGDDDYWGVKGEEE